MARAWRGMACVANPGGDIASGIAVDIEKPAPRPNRHVCHFARVIFALFRVEK